MTVCVSSQGQKGRNLRSLGLLVRPMTRRTSEKVAGLRVAAAAGSAATASAGRDAII